MPCDSRIIGQSLGPLDYDVDPFWTMAYAAGIGDSNPRYLDSMGSGELIAHPVFPACLATRARWRMEPMFLAAGLTPEESLRSVHATQEMILERLIRPPEKLSVTATVTGMERRRAGTLVTTHFDIRDSANEPVSTINWGRLWRGVDMTGPERPASSNLPACPTGAATHRASYQIPIAVTAAIVYTACARADNQVSFHTDTTAAKRSGLHAPLLMGVAGLAMSVSRIVDGELGGDPESIARISCRFRAMVFMPNQLTLNVTARDGDRIYFELLTSAGDHAIRDGVLELRR
ncbi:MAG TPA: MaoC family dehydratase N-terminal domain-containing protein [Candidatus Binataceae bacterium]|nr:MaoC family dehydratase N-terminal domain-containing protein [Candidatus Binataceae bacterium]